MILVKQGPVNECGVLCETGQATREDERGPQRTAVSDC